MCILTYSTTKTEFGHESQSIFIKGQSSRTESSNQLDEYEQHSVPGSNYYLQYVHDSSKILPVHTNPEDRIPSTTEASSSYASSEEEDNINPKVQQEHYQEPIFVKV